MFKDLTGTTRYKLGLHVHTTLSDGRKTPEEVAAIYRDAGYDAIAITDHWIPGKQTEIGGMPILPGCEYNIGGNRGGSVYHILGIGYDQTPDLHERPDLTAQEIVDRIHDAGGLAILAHPAWSLNRPEEVAMLHGFDGTEIYNTVSSVHASNRPYSGAFVDLLACHGVAFSLTAADDSHYYDNDVAIASTMVAAEDGTPEALLAALRRGDFYATLGPEVHLVREGNTLRVLCSPAVCVSFFSNIVWTAERNTYGEALTEATYPIHPGETFVRAEVTDREGKVGYSNIIRL